MPSPFPGMDPYLEDPAFWQDFHTRFVTHTCDLLSERLPANYDARIDEHVQLIELTDDESQLVLPDVTVMRGRASEHTSTATGTITLEPVTVPMVMVEEFHQRYIKIRRRPDWELVTAVELLSPANKADPSRGQYLAKRHSFVAQEVHLVELDLLIGGKRLPMRRPLPPADYYALIAPSEHRPDCDVYSWTLRDPLPHIPIPLKAPDADVVLNLGEVFATTYDRGRYAPVLPYGGHPTTPLPEADLQWVVERAGGTSE